MISTETVSYSNEFMEIYNTFIAWHGARIFREIDIATKRNHEDLESLFERLKAIYTTDSQITMRYRDLRLNS